jgi:LPXTG-motif cell wall-anchored protein
MEKTTVIIVAVGVAAVGAVTGGIVWFRKRRASKAEATAADISSAVPAGA